MDSPLFVATTHHGEFCVLYAACPQRSCIGKSHNRVVPCICFFPKDTAVCGQIQDNHHTLELAEFLFNTVRSKSCSE